MPMTIVDYAVIAVIAGSVLLSVVRGALRELMAIASWVGSAWLAAVFAPGIAVLLPDQLSNPGLRLAGAFVAILLVALLLFALLTLAMTQLVRRSGLTGSDRALGALFGVVRALAILVCLTLVAGLTRLPREPVWRDAASSPVLEALALAARDYFPPALAARIGYD
jgi:membrane protein required for colicin V production